MKNNDKNVYERLFKLWAMVCKMIMNRTRDAADVAEVLQGIVNESPRVGPYVHRLFMTNVILIAATDGTESFTGSPVFTGAVLGKTQSLRDMRSRSTHEIAAAVYEIGRDGSLREVLSSLGESRKRWTESQVIVFVRDHLGLIRHDAYGTLFELESGLAAAVYIDSLDRVSVLSNLNPEDQFCLAKNHHRLIALTT